MGTRITDLKPIQGFCAEAGGAVAFFGATALGVPIYTIGTVTGSIVGMGAARRTSAVRWGVARGIVVAWVITVPSSATIVTACYWAAALFQR